MKENETSTHYFVCSGDQQTFPHILDGIAKRHFLSLALVCLPGIYSDLIIGSEAVPLKCDTSSKLCGQRIPIIDNANLVMLFDFIAEVLSIFVTFILFTNGSVPS